MPRQQRKISMTNTYHVMIRGIERNKIFLENDDKEKFIEILIQKKKSEGYVILAYCIMDNHAHILLREGENGILKAMQRVNGTYAYYYNKKHNRVGHVFQDRFRSEVIEKDQYLLATA